MTACATEQRLDPPPAGEDYRAPWGAVQVEYWEDKDEEVIPGQIVENIAQYILDYRRENPGEKIPFNVLTLSGGGSRGAYGAGVLSGWSQTGSRPEFDLVTGISTGALMATSAFLGPGYDHLLKSYTEVGNEDIYTERGKLALVTGSSLYDTEPLRRLLEKQLTESVIDAVASAYLEGRRLFIGTTNLDANVFTVWNMGKIAASERPERLQLYRDVILASASFPLFFPPVYLPVTDGEGNTYLQMHVDGGMRETVFIYDFMGEIRQLADTWGLDWKEDIDMHVYLLYNGAVFAGGIYDAVEADSLSIALRSMQSLMRKNAVSSIYNVWTHSLRQGATVHATYIHEEVELDPNALNFVPQDMNELYAYGYQRALDGTAWHVQKAPQTQEELEELLDLYYTLDPLDPENVE